MTPEQTVDTNHGHAGRGRRNPGHDHEPDYRSAGRRSLIIVLILLCCHMGIEMAGGILSGSLGLLAHATHMITGAVAIGLALFAMWIAERPATTIQIEQLVADCTENHHVGHLEARTHAEA